MSALIKSELEFAPLSNNYNFINKEGEKIGHLTVLGYAGIRGRRTAYWYCECKCGKINAVSTSNLNCGRVISCGCANAENLGNRRRTLAAWHKREYSTFASAKSRCRNTNNPKYHRYGGRGIKFLYTSFQQFLKDVGQKPTGGIYSIDRINNDGNYEPGNCRWATQKTQARNVSTNIIVTIGQHDYVFAKFFPSAESKTKARSWGRIHSGWPPLAAVFGVVHPSIGATNRRAAAIEYVKGKSLQQLATAAGLIIPPAINAASQPRKIERKKDAA